MYIYIYMYRYIHIYVDSVVTCLANRLDPAQVYRVAKNVGSFKLQIIFHKRATKYRSLLRKMTYKDKGSYESSPPCT